MSIIKDIYDASKDASQLKNKVKSIKKALSTELKLNRKILMDIGNSKKISNERLIKIIEMLETKELSNAVKLDIPYKLISNKKVTNELAEQYKIKRLVNYNIEKLIESLYLKIAYLKKDYKNKSLDINRRLIYIKKYNNILLRLLK